MGRFKNHHPENQDPSCTSAHTINTHLVFHRLAPDQLVRIGAAAVLTLSTIGFAAEAIGVCANGLAIALDGSIQIWMRVYRRVGF